MLSACEAGSAGDDAVQGLGVAQAFLTAGATSVVATTRKVDDAAAAEIVRGLYAAPTEDAASALRRAQIAVLGANARVDWASFRAFVR